MRIHTMERKLMAYFVDYISSTSICLTKLLILVFVALIYFLYKAISFVVDFSVLCYVDL